MSKYFILVKERPSDSMFKQVVANDTYGDYLVFDSEEDALRFSKDMVSIATGYVNRVAHSFNKISAINQVTEELEEMPYSNLIFSIILNMCFNIYNGKCRTVEESKQYIDTCRIVAERNLDLYI